MDSNNTHSKTTSFNLSEQVKAILQKKGYSSIFNYGDYKFFKSQCKRAFNKAQAIAQKFIEEANPENNDFKQYLF